MDTSRVINIILTDLSLENLKLQEKLENLINSNKDVNEKVFTIKDALKSLAINELMITKFQAMVSQTNNNNNLNES
jgi:cell fate (sporulation/competence/biofilm development) regulator YmcA (YheA/YmcA/DUF963 family)